VIPGLRHYACGPARLVDQPVSVSGSRADPEGRSYTTRDHFSGYGAGVLAYGGQLVIAYHGTNGQGYLGCYGPTEPPGPLGQGARRWPTMPSIDAARPGGDPVAPSGRSFFPAGR
jgi:hypothetical protein